MIIKNVLVIKMSRACTRLGTLMPLCPSWAFTCQSQLATSTGPLWVPVPSPSCLPTLPSTLAGSTVPMSVLTMALIPCCYYLLCFFVFPAVPIQALILTPPSRHANHPPRLLQSLRSSSGAILLNSPAVGARLPPITGCWTSYMLDIMGYLIGFFSFPPQ